MPKKRATSAIKASSGRSNRFIKLSSADWKAPAGFHAHEIRRATLREVVDPHIPTKNIPELTELEVYDLAIGRLELLPKNFQMAVMGFGLINKDRALAEVRTRTPLGKHIAILQIKHLQHLLRIAQREINRGRKP